jgi:hypothetical protein
MACGVNGGDTGVRNERGRRIALAALAPVQDDRHLHSPIVRIHESLRDRCRGEGVRLHEDLLFA